MSRNTLLEHKSSVGLLIGILVLGSLWGLSEVAVGGGLKAVEFPYRAGLLTGIGMGVTGIALAYFKRPFMAIGIGLVAAMVNLLVVPVLQVSVMCKANSCIAVFMEASSLGLIAALLSTRTNGNVYTRMGTGAVAALVASAAFYFVGTRVAPCNYLLSFATPGAFVVKEGLVWAAFSAVLLPLGYLAGERLALRDVPLFTPKRLYYASAAATVALCWGISALVISAGF